jgi:hypothetical protein
MEKGGIASHRNLQSLFFQKDDPMRRIEHIGKGVYAVADSTVDENKLYSILLDARASKASESMYDIADTLLKSEKENAKVALEKLWALKKNLQPENATGTVDLLIQFYQVKMDVLRNREERIKKVAQDSRGLLEDKRKRDSEIAQVKQEISDCDSEIERLSLKLTQLKIKEQELTLIESQLKKELQVNANEVVNGLYEIILSQDRIGADGAQPEYPVAAPIAQIQEHTFAQAPVEQAATPESMTPKPVDPRADESASPAVYKVADADAQSGNVIDIELDATPKVPAIAPYPKSVVKTTSGRIIGEYYYDAKSYKNRRHYIFNSIFFGELLDCSVSSLGAKFDQTLFDETFRMIQDAAKRLSESDKLHIEISVNEILNEKTLKNLLQVMKARRYDEIEKFCGKLKAKVEALGKNYFEMLKEQMERYTES